MDSTPAAQLRVSHPATKSNQLGRGLKLSLDGEDLAHLKVGNSLVVNIEAGRHQLRADNTFQAKTVEFDAEPGQQVHYRVSNIVGAIGAVLLGTVGAGPMRLEFERAEPVESSSKPLPGSKPSAE